ncbi:MAG TPA: hypothetical protein VMD30_13545 [Tepidisphaeraceae bacterium]|nr:hypothetical protein [Tepidisphaeraceae bacterium]
MASPQNAPSTAPSTTSPADETPFVLTLPDDPASGNDWYLWAGVLALMVVVTFFQSAVGKFVWDDDNYASAPILSQPDALHQIWFTKGATAQWYPLTYTTFWIDNHLWHDNTIGYHLENFLLHALSAILIWRLLRRLAIPLPWLCAAIWAIHPLQAESVSWIAERKNVLSGFLFFASLWFYVDYADLIDPNVRAALRIKFKPLAYILSLILFTLAMTAKTVVCVLPVVVVLLLWWKRRDIKRVGTWLALAPFFLIGIALSCITIYLETASGGTEQANGTEYLISGADRLFIAARGFWFYIFKLIWPLNLSFSYPRITPGAITGTLYLLAALALIAACWVWRKRIGRAPLTAVLLYTAAIFPSLGFINIYPMRFTFVADHYQYLAGLPLIVLAVAAAHAFFKWAVPPKSSADSRAPISPWPAAVAGLVLLLLMGQAWLRADIYQDDKTLWFDTWQRNPDSSLACENLAKEDVIEADGLQAEANLMAKYDPNKALQDRADEKTDFDNATTLYNRARKERPDNFIPYWGLAQIAERHNDWKTAESDLATAVSLEPSSINRQSPAPYIEYAQALAINNRPDVQIRKYFEKGLALVRENAQRLQPSEAATFELSYARYLMRTAMSEADLSQRQRDLELAATHAMRSIQSVPDNPQSLYALGLVYCNLSDTAQLRSDAAKAAGDMAAADKYAQQVILNDARGLDAMEATIKAVPLGHDAGALVNASRLLLKLNFSKAGDEAEALNQLDFAVENLVEAQGYDPTLDLSNFASAVSGKLIDEGNGDLSHPSFWAPLKDSLQNILAATAPSTTANQVELDSLVTSTRQQIVNVLWPLPPQGHPLRQPLERLIDSLEQYQQASKTPQASKAIADIHRKTQAVLAAWAKRIPAQDDLLDYRVAMSCFEQALKADNKSAAAYDGLAKATSLFAAGAAQQGETSTFHDDISAARQDLHDYRAATQPSPQSATAP